MFPVPERVSAVVTPAGRWPCGPRLRADSSIPQMTWGQSGGLWDPPGKGTLPMQLPCLLIWPCPLLEPSWVKHPMSIAIHGSVFTCTWAPPPHVSFPSLKLVNVWRTSSAGRHGPHPHGYYSWWAFRLPWQRIHCFFGFCCTISTINFLFSVFLYFVAF